MKPTRLQRLLTIVDKALALEPEERVEYLDEVCGKDTVLRGEVGELLESAGASENFWEGWKQWNEKQIIELFRGEEDPETEQRVGPWKLIRQLGRGGMGTVWLAERTDGSYEQQVALKLLHRGMETGESAHRFKQERQILARLDHPQIARLYDGGHTDNGLPWLAMEYIDGLPVTRWCDEQGCTLKQRLALFEEICGAIRYAHRNLIVHRDLKPENILVTKEGHIKILDFGIAKLLDEELPPEERIRTRTGLRAMSLDYAAPEQITGEPITTATDVYALGLLLYELLTGGYPYDLEGKNLRQIEQTIRTEEPVRPSVFPKNGQPAVRPELRGDLDAITLKALRKETDGRYENAGQLLEDLHRFQRNQPVEARQGTMQYRVGKWIRRHRWTAASVLVVVLSLVLGIGVAMWQAREADRAAEQATLALAETEQALSRAEALQEFLLDLFRSAEPDRPRDQLPTTEEILALGAERAMDEDSAPPAERIAMLLAISEIYIFQNRQEFVRRAQPLLHTAVALAHKEERSEDLARVLLRQAEVARFERRFDDAEELLLEAEALVRTNDTWWDTFAGIRSYRGWIEIGRGDPEQAIELLEPLYEKMLVREEQTLPYVRQQLLNHLMAAYRNVGNLKAAHDLQIQLVQTVRTRYGSESRDYAIQLANMADIEMRLGQFDSAIDKLNEAITLYDRIFDDKPVEFRASARTNLANTLLYTGRFDQAQLEMRAAYEEWTQAWGREIVDYERYFYRQGRLLARMHRWPEAEQHLQRARELLMDMENTPIIGVTLTEVSLAWVMCRQDQADEALLILTDLEDQLAGKALDHPADRLLLHEARATCHYQTGHLDLALPEIDSALALAAETSYPGRVMHQADRRILRARILADLNRHTEAEEELNRAEQAYLDLDLAGHPHFPLIETARQELFGNGDL